MAQAPEYAKRLEAFAQERGKVRGQPVSNRTSISPDPIADLDNTLIKAIEDVGADLVVMPTHPPSNADVVMPSHGGKVATHTKASIFLVRPTGAN